MVQWISKADTAKLVRAELKKHFPGVKFKVTCDRGSAIRVEWYDGPRLSAVEKVAGHFEHSYMDLHEDMKKTKDHDAPVQYANDFIFFTRLYSVDFYRRIVAHLSERFGVEMPPVYKCNYNDEGRLAPYSEYTALYEQFHKRFHWRIEDFIWKRCDFYTLDDKGELVFHNEEAWL
jgi:hypothetical protein